MECPRCQAMNRDGRRFCASCGAGMSFACVDCGFANQPGEHFCGGCGKPLAKEGPVRRADVVEPQRRQLTVMFCDLVGSTLLAHQLDPEDLREIIRGYQKVTADVIARYGGFVSRYMGDGVLTYFGYPQAHEDDAARAIHTALEIIEAMEERPTRHASPLHVRIGIATGLVVVGDMIGEGASEEAAVVGETPNLAARLQSFAEPGTVLISQATSELARGLFEYEDRGSHKLKGFPQPVHTWRVLRKSATDSRFDATRSQRLTPLIGRRIEVERMLQSWQLALAGTGQVIVLTGEAGIGKSRLLEEFLQRTAREPYAQLRAQCSPYHTNSALYPFIKQLDREANFRNRDSAAERLDRLETVLSNAFEQVQTVAPLFAALLSLPTTDRYPLPQLTPQEQSKLTLEALIDRLGGLAKRGPAVLVLEDVHWIDPTSAELLTLLVNRIVTMPVLIIVISRTTAAYPWLALEHISEIKLKRLDRRHSATIVSQVLGGRRVPQELIDQIVDRTDGVPLFIEEVTKTLASSVTQVPSTLQDSLMARLDQLGTAKDVAQTAAVIGREFSRDLLAAIVELDQTELHDALQKLIEAEIVFVREHPSRASLIFKHALMEDAAYASLLNSKRQELHLRVAQALERDYPERVRAEPEVVAHHYTQAGRALEGVRYWGAAARQALDRSASLEVLGHATKGLDTLTSVAPSAERTRLEADLEILRGAAYRAQQGFASSEVERSFARAQELCEQLADTARLIETQRGLFACYYVRGDLSAACNQAIEVAAVGEKLHDSDFSMLAHWMMGCATFWRGELPISYRELQAATALYDPGATRTKALALQIDLGVNARFHLGWLLWTLGYADRAVTESNHAIATARRLAQPFSLSMALFVACVVRTCCGHSAAVRQMLEELKPLTAKHDLAYVAACALVIEAQELIANGDCKVGIERVERALDALDAQEAGIGIPWIRSVAASAYLKLGMPTDGLAAIATAIAAATREGENHWLAELLRLKGELLSLPSLQQGEEAEIAFRSAIDVAQRQSARALELRATLSLSRLQVRQGQHEIAQRALHAAYSWFTEGFGTLDMRTTARTLEQMTATLGRTS